ncbi:hypothetical protein C8R43DRAFT_1120874 [Mycena crocata]|nr:hypothetical protein C8R43DRAFT_1120874 [Mycena crocata]
MTQQELWATTEYKEFMEFCSKVKKVTLTYDAEDPQQVEDFHHFMDTNPCVEDLPPYDEESTQWVYWCHLVYGHYPEWREELADYRDFISEMTPAELDKRQLEKRLTSGAPHTLWARGGF